MKLEHADTPRKEAVKNGLQTSPKDKKMTNLKKQADKSSLIKPVGLDQDQHRDQKQEITCAKCGKTISFIRKEVYVNDPSYVCKAHAQD